MKRYHYPVVFTGAGISVASGLPTFDITWNGVPIRDLLTSEFFDRDPVGFYEMFREVEQWKDAQPNPAHYALAEAKMPVVTQNVDGLHQKAGSTKVYEVHGNLREMICLDCYRITPWKNLTLGVPYCDCGRILKPRVVLYGDDLMDWDESVREMQKADLVLVIGCSLQTAPACYLPQMAQARGADIIEVNEKAEVEVPGLVRELGILQLIHSSYKEGT
jgi:NAD-dependent deacetylase